MNPSCHSSQVIILFHEVNLMSLVDDAESAGHAGQAAANHQRRFVDGKVKLLQGF